MIHGTTTAAFLAAKMAERTRQHLRLVVTHPDGTQTTVYPKDHSTKTRWTAGYTRKGCTVSER